jgi:hypothetical protein
MRVLTQNSSRDAAKLQAMHLMQKKLWERATAYEVSTSTAPGALKGQIKGFARMFGRDWGVTGRECFQVDIQNIHSDAIWNRVQPNALEVMVLGGSAPPCQQAFGIMDCKCRSYTVGDNATMLMLQF